MDHPGTTVFGFEDSRTTVLTFSEIFSEIHEADCFMQLNEADLHFV